MPTPANQFHLYTLQVVLGLGLWLSNMILSMLIFSIFNNQTFIVYLYALEAKLMNLLEYATLKNCYRLSEFCVAKNPKGLIDAIFFLQVLKLFLLFYSFI